MTDVDFERALTAAINLQIDLPFLDESQEAAMLAWVVSPIVPLIPEAFRQFVLDAMDGVSAEELGRLAIVVAMLIQSRKK